MIRFILVQVSFLLFVYFRGAHRFAQNRQGKTRLAKWYVPYDDDEKVRKVLPDLLLGLRSLRFAPRSGSVERYTGS